MLIIVCVISLKMVSYSKERDFSSPYHTHTRNYHIRLTVRLKLLTLQSH
jgi:hypothetical protein